MNFLTLTLNIYKSSRPIVVGVDLGLDLEKRFDRLWQGSLIDRMRKHMDDAEID